MNILELDDVVKQYGRVPALAGLTMNVAEGDVYGFLGRNGAGKSTALNVIMGVTFADSGELRLFGKRVRGDDPAPRRSIGYVAQEQHFYEWMTAQRIGRFVAGFYPSWDAAEYDRLLTLLEVPKDRKILGFSGGARVKLALALALAHRPRLLLLDEPTAGMDAVSRREFIDIVRDQAVRSERTTLFSSHYIDEIEQAASTIGVIDEGRMRYEGPLEALRGSVKRLLLEEEHGDEEPPALQACAVLKRTSNGAGTELIVRLPEDGGENELRELAALGRIEQPSLEDIFIAMVGKQVPI